MNITDVRIHLIGNSEATVNGSILKGIASFTVDDALVVNDVKIIEGNRGLFIGMPSKQRENGTFWSVTHPINNETRLNIQGAIIKRYLEIISGDI